MILFEICQTERTPLVCIEPTWGNCTIAGFPKLFFQIAPFGEFKKAIAP